MRLAWTLFSMLIALSAGALCLLSPIDPLRWVAEAAFGSGTLVLPAAVLVARLAEAILAGLAVAQLLVLLPLSADAWIDGGRRLAAARRALDGAAADQAPDPAALGEGAVAAWQPLLVLFAGQGGGRDAPQPVPGLAAAGLRAVIDDLVANQSGAGVFRSFPMVAVCLGLIALAAQLLPVLAAGATDDPVALGTAAARGVWSLAAATAIAVILGLVSRLVAATLRHRAERLGAALDRATRQWRSAQPEQSAELVAMPLPRAVERRGGSTDDALVENVAARIWQMPGSPGREAAESVENAIRELHASTLKPMLHDISRLLGVLGERATHLVDAVDDRLNQQTEHIRQILAATTEIARAIAERGQHPGNGADGADPAALQELRRILGATGDAQVAALRGVSQDLATQLDTVLRGAMRSIARPVSMQTEALRKTVEQVGVAADAMTRVGAVFEQSSATIERKLDQLIEAQAGASGNGGGDAAAGPELRAAAADVVAFARAGREALESIADLSGQIKRDAAAATQAPAAVDHAAPGDAEGTSWAQRIGALQRAARDLTGSLPPLAVEKPD